MRFIFLFFFFLFWLIFFCYYFILFFFFFWKESFIIPVAGGGGIWSSSVNSFNVSLSLSLSMGKWMLLDTLYAGHRPRRWQSQYPEEITNF